MYYRLDFVYLYLFLNSIAISKNFNPSGLISSFFSTYLANSTKSFFTVCPMISPLYDWHNSLSHYVNNALYDMPTKSIIYTSFTHTS